VLSACEHFTLACTLIAISQARYIVMVVFLKSTSYTDVIRKD